MLKAFAAGRMFGEKTGDGVPWVLALHGWRRTHTDFGATLAGLSGLALDLPGFGATPPPPEAWGTGEYADAVAAVLPEMAERVVVVGHSFGGRVAVRLAAAHPDRVAAVVLTGAPLVRPPGVAPRKPSLRFRAGRAMHRFGLVSERRMEELRRRHGSADYRAAEGIMRDVLVKTLKETYEDALTALAAPLELVWGDDDDSAPLAGAREIVRMVPDATLVVVPGAGHLLPQTAPDALRAAIERHRP